MSDITGDLNGEFIALESIVWLIIAYPVIKQEYISHHNFP